MEDQPKPLQTKPPAYEGLTCGECCYYGADQENAAPESVMRQAPCRRYPPTLGFILVPGPGGQPAIGQASGHVQVMRTMPACGECAVDVPEDGDTVQ